MARGGYRAGAGRPRKEAGTPPSVKNEAAAHRPRKSLGGMTPLEYMLSVMNDESADPSQRDRMAIAAAPYVHPRASDAQPGKKEQRQAAAEEVASGGKFTPRGGPRLAVSNE